jgi:hypothetical protein
VEKRWEGLKTSRRRGDKRRAEEVQVQEKDR